MRNEIQKCTIYCNVFYQMFATFAKDGVGDTCGTPIYSDIVCK